MIQHTLLALWIFLIGGAGVWLLVGSVGYWIKLNWWPADAAVWVQAVGTVVAIFVSIGLASHQYRQGRRDNLRSEYSNALTALSHAGFAYGAVAEACKHLQQGYKDSESPRRVLAHLEDARDNLRVLPLCSDYGCAIAIADVKRCLVDAIGMVELEVDQPGYHGNNTIRPKKLLDRAQSAFDELKSAFAEYSLDLGPCVYEAVIRSEQAPTAGSPTINDDVHDR